MLLGSDSLKSLHFVLVFAVVRYTVVHLSYALFALRFCNVCVRVFVFL